MTLIKSKRTWIRVNDPESAQKSLNELKWAWISLNEPKCPKMYLNKLKGAWVTLNKQSKWAQMSLNKRLIESKWASIGLIELKQAQMSVN